MQSGAVTKILLVDDDDMNRNLLVAMQTCMYGFSDEAGLVPEIAGHDPGVVTRNVVIHIQFVTLNVPFCC